MGKLSGTSGKTNADTGCLPVFVDSDGGRAVSKRSRQRNDCTVRALALTTVVPYDEAYDRLMAAGRKSSRSFAITRWLPKSGIGFTKVSYPAVKGQRRMTLGEFALGDGSEGRWIACCAKHVIAVIDGAIHDDGKPRYDACVYSAFRMGQSESERKE